MAKSEFSWQDHVDKVTAKGLLAKQLYVIQTKPINGLQAVLDNLQEHLAYQLELERKGVMFAAGPFADDDQTRWEGEGMVIIRADSVEEARRIAADDPMHKSGAREYRVRPWMLNEGSITLKITYSDGQREVL